MKSFLKVFLGFILGIVCTIGVSFIFASKPDIPISYFDVKTKKATVKMHTAMPKDSVFFLLGSPDDFSSNTISGHVVEHAGYKIKNQYITDLNFTFVDGLLTDFEQN